MDLSWSHRLKTDAPTLVKDIKKEIKKHMDFICANINQFENVSYALREGEKTLGTILCRTCRRAVESKRREIHSQNQTEQKKKKLKKLSPERQQILNEITNNFLQLERSKSEDEGEEYCTEGEYYREEMLEMESMYKNKLFDKQDEMAEIETELKKVANDRDEFKKKIDSMSKKVQSCEKMETELHELKGEKERLKEDLDKAGISIKKLKREIDQKEEDIERYRSSSSGYRTRLFTNSKDDEISRLKVALDSRDKELQTAKTENENLKTEQNEVIRRLEEEKQSLREAREALGKKCDELKAMKSQLEVLEKAKRKQTDEKQEAYDKIHQEKENCMRDVSQLQSERQILQDQKDSLNRTVKELASTLKAKEQNIDKLTRELGQYHRQETSTQTEAQREVDKKSKPCSSFTAGSWKDAMHNEQERLRSELDRIHVSQEKDQIQKKYDNLTLELSQLDQTNSEQRNQITHMVRRLLRTSQSGLEKTMVDMVTEELTKQVGERLDPRNFDFSIVPSETSAGVSKGPLFVVCLNSMVGKNVPDALEGPKGGRDLYLLVLHQTTRENVSTLRPDSLRNTGSELQQLGGVIDMVFSSESGLVECDVNKTAVDHIATVLKKY